jgi:hypothetical protein
MRHLTFICYAHRDVEFMERLRIHLRPYERNSAVKVWSDVNIGAGKEWREEIRNALAESQAAVLLVSPDFLASDFIHQNELPRLLKAAEKEGLTVLWVPISDSSYTETPIAKYQAVSDPAKPLKMMSEGGQDRVWVRLCTQLKNLTWGLTIEITSTSQESHGRVFTIKGKATFRPSESLKASVSGLAAALRKMNLKLVPFVYNVDNGWWAQPQPVPDINGDFSGQVFIGKEGTVDVGKQFDVRVCAIDANFPGWRNGSDTLPAVRIDSNTLTVKRVD